MKNKDEKLIFRCFNCKKNYEKDFNKELIKRFANTYSLCSKDLNKFILLLGKSFYPYEYMDNWEIFDETSLPDKKSFYSSLNMENINDIDYRHSNNVFKNVKLDLLNDYDMLLMVEEGIRRGICHTIHRYAKANNKCMKNYDKNR